MITSLDQLDFNKTYTYADYLTWQFKERVELIRGKILKMSPAPSRKHQKLAFRFTLALGQFLKNKKCEIYPAPFDVVLKRKGKDTVVQPDICVICDLSKLTDQGCTGAPELIVEILSPGNSKREMKIKMELYEENGVLEYWIVDPERETITLYHLKDGVYIPTKPYTTDDVVPSSVLQGFEVAVEKVFEE